MIALSTSTALRWSAPWEADDGSVFIYTAASVTERALFEAEAAAYQAGQVFSWDLERQFFEGLKALIPDLPEDIDRLVDINTRANNDDNLTPAETIELEQVTSRLIKYWSPLRALVEQAARREAIMPILSFRRFVTNWENVTDHDGNIVPFVRGIDGMVKEELLAHIPSITLRACGVDIYQGLYARGAEKNFVPPSKSARRRRTSGTAAMAKGGKSAKTSGEKTQP